MGYLQEAEKDSRLTIVGNNPPTEALSAVVETLPLPIDEFGYNQWVGRGGGRGLPPKKLANVNRRCNELDE